MDDYLAKPFRRSEMLEKLLDWARKLSFANATEPQL
jgi:hypothetical protein